jgi:hypothetical protein
VAVEIDYGDQEFRVWFRRAGVAADFRTIDRELLGSRSRFQGDMFPPQKLKAAIDLVAAQVHDGFSSILEGEERVWQQIAKVVNAPTDRPRLP